METPFDQVFFGIMALNIGIVFCLILINFVKEAQDSFAKVNAKKVLGLLKEFRSYQEGTGTQGTERVNRGKYPKKTGERLRKLLGSGRIFDELMVDKSRSDEILRFCIYLNIAHLYVRKLEKGSKWGKAEACRVLGLMRDPRYIDPLIFALDDKNPEVRAAAAQALGDIGDVRGLIPLTPVLNDENKWVVLRAVDSLILLSRGYSEVLVPFLQHRLPEVRSQIARVLGQTHRKNALPFLLSALDTESEEGVKVEIIQAIGELGLSEAIVPLIGILEGEDHSAQIETIKALRKIGDDRAIPPLIGLLERTDWELKHEVFGALKDFKDSNLIIQLIETLITTANKALIHGVLSFLMEGVKDEKLVPVLIKILNDPDPEVVSKAIEALGDQRDTRATIPLIFILRSSEHWFLKVRAAKALGKIGDARALKSLREQASSENHWIRQRVSESIELIESQIGA